MTRITWTRVSGGRQEGLVDDHQGPPDIILQKLGGYWTVEFATRLGIHRGTRQFPDWTLRQVKAWAEEQI